MHDQRNHVDITHTILSVLFVSSLILFSVWIVRPFLPALTWAVLIVVSTWPLLLKLDGWLGGRRGLAVTVMTLAALLLLLVPLALAAVMLLSHTDDILARLRSFDFSLFATPPEWLERIPVAGKKLAERWATFAELSGEARRDFLAPYGRTAIQWIAAKAGNFGLIFTQSLLTLILLPIFFSNGEKGGEAVRNFARRLAGRHGEEAVQVATKATRGVVLGVTGTALIQTALGFIGLLISGIPGIALLTALMGLFCLAQLGPLLVLVPVTIGVYWTGHPGLGTAVLIVSIVAGTVDNVVRPLLIRKGVEMPLLLIIGGVIGGLIAFGMIGLFIGPVLLAVTHSLLKTWIGVPLAPPLASRDRLRKPVS